MCSKRSNTHDCTQDYVRADRIESIIIDDIKTIFADREFLEQGFKGSTTGTFGSPHKTLLELLRRSSGR